MKKKELRLIYPDKCKDYVGKMEYTKSGIRIAETFEMPMSEEDLYYELLTFDTRHFIDQCRMVTDLAAESTKCPDRHTCRKSLCRNIDRILGSPFHGHFFGIDK